MPIFNWQVFADSSREGDFRTLRNRYEAADGAEGLAEWAEFVDGLRPFAEAGQPAEADAEVRRLTELLAMGAV